MENDMRKMLLMTTFALLGACAAAHADSSSACNPRNVPPNERADWLHQNRPGGSDCTPQSARRSEDEALARQRQFDAQRYDDRRYDRGDRWGDPRDEGYSGSSRPPSRTYRPY
jgi:hypothetical protein